MPVSSANSRAAADWAVVQEQERALWVRSEEDDAGGVLVNHVSVRKRKVPGYCRGFADEEQASDDIRLLKGANTSAGDVQAQSLPAHPQAPQDQTGEGALSALSRTGATP